MQSRLAIILMSVAGATLLFCTGLLFGLGVMSSPKGGHRKEIAVTNEPVKVARRETTGSAGNPQRALTPFTPVHPGISEPDQTASAPQPQPAPAQAAATPAVQTAAQAAPPPAPAPAAQVSAQPAPSAPAQAATAAPQKAAEPAPKEAEATPAPSTSAPAERPVPANATPVALHARNSCDVDACARTYKSFRQSDCTYQPYSGPRQLCVSPPAPAKEASRGDERSAAVRVHRGGRDVEVQNVPRDGARVTDGASPRDEDALAVRRQFRRDIAADGEDDGIDDSRVILRRSDDRGYGDRGWHRSFFAPVEDDDDDQ